MKNKLLKSVVLLLTLFVALAILSGCGQNELEENSGEKISNTVVDNDNSSDEEILENQTQESPVATVPPSSTPTKPETSVPKTSIIVGGYTLQFGTYTGTITQYNWETEEDIIHTVKLVLSENTITIDGETGSYSISGSSIVWKGQDYILQVAGNNQIQYMAETCPILVYQGQ